MPPENRAKLNNVLIGFGLAAVYFLAGKAGLTLAFVQANATAVWPPTGIALAALLILGYRFWPGIFLGAFLVNITTAGSVATSLGIAVGNSLEALTGAYLVDRFANGRMAFNRSVDVFKFAILAGTIGTLVSPTLGVGSLFLAGYATNIRFIDVWITWWLGDMGGALLVAPLLILGARYPWSRLKNIPYALEGAGLLTNLAAVAWIELSGQTMLSIRHYPLEIFFIPPLVWAAVRFGQAETSFVSFLTTASAVFGTLHGFGPLKGETQNESLLLLQAFMNVTSVMVLVLAANVFERRQAQKALQQAHEGLESRVQERTRDLRAEVEERRQVEDKLRKSEEELRGQSGLLESIMQNMGEGLIVCDENGKILFDNAAAKNILRGEVGRPISGDHSTKNRIFKGDRVTPLTPEEFPINKALLGEASDNVELFIRNAKKPEGLSVLVTSRPLRDAEGRIHGGVSVFRDVTEQNRRDEERRRLALLVETSPNFICLTSVDGHMIYLNGAGRQLVGLPLEEDIHFKLHEDFLFPEDVPGFRNEVLAALLSKGHWSGDFRLKHFSTGEALPFDFTTVLIRDPATGEPQALAGIGRDITRQKAAEKKLKEKSTDLELMRVAAVASNQATTLEEAMDIALTAVCIHTGWPMGHVYRLSGPPKQEMVSTRIWYMEYPSRYEAFRRKTEATCFAIGVGLPGRILASGKAEWIADVTEDINFLRLKSAAQVGLKGAFGFPVLANNQVVAVMEFFSEEKVRLEPAFLELMGNVGAQLGRVVERQAVAEKDERFRFLVENIQDYAIYFLDPEGRVMTWNTGAQRIKGYGSEEIIGQSFSRFYSTEDIRLGKPEKLIKLALEQGRAEEEAWHIRKDGSRFWADSILTVMRDEKGHLRGFAKITRDITQLKRMEELSRSNKELEQFAYVASHDLQEPLRMVASYVQLLARQYEGKLDAEADLYIHEAADGAKRMQALIRDLLLYSRVDKGNHPFGKVDCEEALRQTLVNLEQSLLENKALVTHGALPQVKGDFNQVVQLFQNLIANAVKFKGPQSPQIQVEARQQGKEWLFSVKDNGIGIDPQYAEQIFEVFKRLHTRDEYPGTGIGLAICKKVVARHGGRIWVESQPEKGAAFYWTMPVVPAEKVETLDQPSVAQKT